MSDAAAAVLGEMKGAVRTLSDGGSAKAANARISRITGLPVSVIERLRYGKFKWVPAHYADAIRTALLEHIERQEERFRHEADQLRALRAARAAVARRPDMDRDVADGVREAR